MARLRGSQRIELKVRAVTPDRSHFDQIEATHQGELFTYTEAHEVERFSYEGKTYRFVLEGVSTFGSTVVYPLAVCYEDTPSARIYFQILFDAIPRQSYRCLTRKQMKFAFADPGFQRLKASD